MPRLHDFEQQAISVSSFATQMDQCLQQMGDFLIRGEISQINFRNHLYFTIKDENAALSCILFASKIRSVAFQPQVGQEVLISAKNSLYQKRGTFTLQVNAMELAGRGQIMEELKRLEQKLRDEHVLHSRQLPRPTFFHNVAVITSVTGRVRYDIANNVEKRFPGLTLWLFDAKVQGPGAPQSLANALHTAYSKVEELNLDAIIVARGGGSFEELLCFSDESVVRTVAQSPVFIISAIGHDEDCPLCDQAADIRVSTPTAAAIYITPYTKEDLLSLLDQYAQRVDNALLRHLDDLQSQFDFYAQRLTNKYLLQPAFERVDSRINRAVQRAETSLLKKQQFLAYCVHRAEGALANGPMQQKIYGYERHLQNLVARLDRVPQRLFNLSQALDTTLHSTLPHVMESRLRQQEQERLDYQHRLYVAFSETTQQKILELTTRLQEVTSRITPPKSIPLLQQRVTEIEHILNGRVETSLQEKEQQLLSLGQRLDINLGEGEQTKRELPWFFDSLLTKHAEERITQATKSVEEVPKHLAKLEEVFDSLMQRLAYIAETALAGSFTCYEKQLELCCTRLIAAHPLRQIEKGFTFSTLDGQHALDSKDLKKGDSFTTYTAHHAVRSKVESIEPLPWSKK